MTNLLIFLSEIGASNYLIPVIKDLSKYKLNIKVLITSSCVETFRFNNLHYDNVIEDDVYLKDFIDNNDFDKAILSATGSKFENRILTKLNTSSCLTYSFIDSHYNYMNRFTYKNKIIFPKKIFVIDEDMRNCAFSSGIPKKNYCRTSWGFKIKKQFNIIYRSNNKKNL